MAPAQMMYTFKLVLNISVTESPISDDVFFPLVSSGFYKHILRMPGYETFFLYFDGKNIFIALIYLRNRLHLHVQMKTRTLFEKSTSM